MSLQLITHILTKNGEEESVKIIGIAEDGEQAAALVEEMKKLPGFRDHPEGFMVNPYQVGQYDWQQGFEVEPPAPVTFEQVEDALGFEGTPFSVAEFTLDDKKVIVVSADDLVIKNIDQLRALQSLGVDTDLTQQKGTLTNGT